jgi:hypothetical protein
MGVFTEWQPRYAGIAGIATLPIDPETKFWRGPGQKIGLPASTKFTRNPEAEVVNCALSAWRYEERGENYYGGRGVVTCTPDIVDDLAIANADAFALLMVARRHHWEDERFCLANPMAEKTLGWTLPRLRRARQYLEQLGYISVLHRGGRGPGDPTVYRWPRNRRQAA